ncbi:MAG: hypothetical protein PUF48_03905, partial [Oscillospiraceae bacterium]|nr:hypothetical protein [Oscillospiraceae bacterium]
FVLFFSVFLIVYPDNAKSAVSSGLILCGNVIIPSLFPFTFCSLYILNSKVNLNFPFLNKITKKLFSLSGIEFSVFLLSLIGGYPTGAKLINETYKQKKISCRKANFMLCYCVNSGPAFLIMTVGFMLLSSKKLGYILFISHILSSLFIALFLKRFIAKENYEVSVLKNEVSISKAIISSVYDAAATVLSICSYVILFSVINSFLGVVLKNFAFLNFVTYILEVTLSVTKTKNIYLIAFLCGLGGISIWFQIMAQAKDFKKNIPLFITFRFVHGLLSTLLTFISIKIFNISIPTVSNGISVVFKLKYSSTALFFSLITLGILFIISTQSKKVWQNG